MSGYFCSETIFNLSNRVLIDTEINVLEKRSRFCSNSEKNKRTRTKRMRLNCHFRHESENFSEAPVFNPKSKSQPPQGHLCLEVFLSQVENELFELPQADIKYFNLSREEWNAIGSLADDRNIIIKKADKGSFIVIWGRNDYLKEAEKQLSDKKVYQEMSNKMFSSLKNRVYITEKQLKYFSYEYRKAANSEFLDYHLKPLMQRGLSFIKDSGDFIKTTRNLGSIPGNAVLVTTTVLGLYLAYPGGRIKSS